MKEVNKHRFEFTTRDFRSLGAEVESCLEMILNLDYGYYKLDNEDLVKRLALTTIEGMQKWQWENNKGIELIGSFNCSLHIYDKEESQRRQDEAIKKLNL